MSELGQGDPRISLMPDSSKRLIYVSKLHEGDSTSLLTPEAIVSRNPAQHQELRYTRIFSFWRNLEIRIANIEGRADPDLFRSNQGKLGSC